MKRLLLFVVCYLLISSAQSQTTVNREFCSHDYDIAIITDEFVVLDINYDEKLVAFKHVYHLPKVYDVWGELYKKPCNCKYIGMEYKPYAAVVLGVYDLKEQKYLKTFTIYNAAYEETDCNPYELSVKMLDSAKTYFAKHNLDITNKPVPVKLKTVDGKKNFPLNIEVVVQFTHKNIKFEYNNIWISDGDIWWYNTQSQLFTYSGENDENKKSIYVINQSDDYAMASGGRIDYMAVYESNGKFVLLNCFHHFNHMAGGADTEIYHFSPVFNLSDFTDE